MKMMFFKKALFILGTVLFFTGCSNDDDQVEKELPKAQVSNIEIGLANNEIGVIGQDFHFNMDILAATKLGNIEVEILQRAGETYSKVWQHKVIWNGYKGVKNTNVHKHFDIPADAAEGTYDFIIKVHDENGSVLQETRKITLWTKENLPVNPTVYTFFISASPTDEWNFEATSANKGDLFYMVSNISNVKDDGEMYLMLINKKHNHRPESVNTIDFSKVIVYEHREHKGYSNTRSFSVAGTTRIKIGEPTKDKLGNTINWESGSYYCAMIYHNKTHNMGTFEYTEITLNL